MRRNPTISLARIMALLGLFPPLAGCGAPEDDAATGWRQAASATSFAGVVSLCPATSNWGAWSQTSLSTWDGDVRPVVQWIMSRTGTSSSTYQGHDPSIGRAADWRPHSRDEGTRLANWFLANTKSGGATLGVKYIIWQAQIYMPSTGVNTMADRGSVTQNHCDHIHISFVDSGSVHFDASQTTAWGTSPAPDAGHRADARPKPPAPDGGAPPAQASADAGVPAPAASEDDTAGAAVSESPPAPDGSLLGGCSFAAYSPSGGLWLFGLVCLASLAAARRGRREKPGRRVP